MTDAQPLDPAAVEAAMRIHHHYYGVRSLNQIDARIITDAYTEQTIELNGLREVAGAFREGADGIYRLTTKMIETRARLAAERVVREKLVEALKMYVGYEAWTCHTHETSVAALAEAKKLTA